MKSKKVIFLSITLLIVLTFSSYRYKSEVSNCDTSFIVTNQSKKSREIISKLNVSDYGMLKISYGSFLIQEFYWIGKTIDNKAFVLADYGYAKDIFFVEIEPSLAYELIERMDSLKQGYFSKVNVFFAKNNTIMCNFIATKKAGVLHKNLIFGSFLSPSDSSIGSDSHYGGVKQSNVRDFIRYLKEFIIKDPRYQRTKLKKNSIIDFMKKNIIEVSEEEGTFYEKLDWGYALVGREKSEVQKEIFYEIESK